MHNLLSDLQALAEVTQRPSVDLKVHLGDDFFSAIPQDCVSVFVQEKNMKSPRGVVCSTTPSTGIFDLQRLYVSYKTVKLAITANYDSFRQKKIKASSEALQRMGCTL